MVHLYTGEGKGKTTAAVGLCIRAAGWDFKVCFAQFMKGNDTGELHVLEKLPNVTILRSGKNFGFYNAMSDTDKGELTEIHNGILDKLLEIAGSGNCNMIIMDEVTYPVKWGLLDIGKLKRLFMIGKEKSDNEIELVLTGRGAGKFLRDFADYVTEMECISHPYTQGLKARKGIEF